MIAAGLVAALAWLFAPEKTTEFKPLDYLGYEAIAMEEDASGRLDFPSQDFSEITDYLNTYPGLGFTPRVLSKMPNGWEPEGATVIDYEVAKVVAVQYKNDTLGEKVFHFSFAGGLEGLPPSEVASKGTFDYQSYDNDELNFIAWTEQGAVSLLVGRRSTVQLAEIGQLSSN